MRLLQTDSFLVLRAAKGFEGYDDGKGNWVEAKESTTRIKAKGSIQPVTGDDLNKLPEAFKNTESLKIYTKQELKTVDDTINREADIVVIDNKRYQVGVVEKWRQLSTKHYKVFVMLEEKV
jgi:hypothetical protein